MSHLVATVDRPRPRVAVLSPVGELDAYMAPELREQLHDLAAEESLELLVVDLSRVTFLDSSALGVLVGALRRLRERKRTLRLVEPRPTVRRIFEITLLDRAFAFCATLEEALAAPQAAEPPSRQAP
jgi:anti-sigma B factor antagonist